MMKLKSFIKAVLTGDDYSNIIVTSAIKASNLITFLDMCGIKAAYREIPSISGDLIHYGRRMNEY